MHVIVLLQQYNLLLEIPKMNKCNSEEVEHEMCMLHDSLYFETVLEEGTCLEVLSKKKKKNLSYLQKVENTIQKII